MVSDLDRSPLGSRMSHPEQFSGCLPLFRQSSMIRIIRKARTCIASRPGLSANRKLSINCHLIRGDTKLDVRQLQATRIMSTTAPYCLLRLGSPPVKVGAESLQ